MSQDTPPAAAPETTPAPKPKKRKWLRRLILGTGVIIVLLVLLVVLLPTILSMGFVKNIAASQIQENVLPSGRVEIEAINLGWFSGQKITTVKLFDADNRQMAVASFDTGLTLLDAVRQNFNIRQTVGSINFTRLVYFADGTTNLSRAMLPKAGAPSPSAPTSPAPAPQPGPAPQPAKPEPIKLPEIKGDVTLHLDGSVEIMDDDGKLAETIQLRPSTVHVDLKDINAGIPLQVAIAYATGSGKQSKLDVDLVADAIENQTLLLDKPGDITAKGFVSLSDIDLSVLNILLSLAKAEPVHVSGLANGKIDIDLKGKGAGGTDGEIVITKPSASPAALNGDTLVFDRITIPLQSSFVTGPNGPVLDLTKIGIYADDQLAVSLTGSVPQAIIDALAADQGPVGDGWMKLLVQLNQPQKTLAMLAKTLPPAPDTAIEGGLVEFRTDVNFKRNVVDIVPTFVASLRGTHAGNRVQVSPITLLSKATLDATKKLEATSLLQATYDLSSEFVKAGGTVTEDMLTNKYWFELGVLREQLAQFVDLSTIKLAGTAHGTLDVTGKVLEKNSPLDVALHGSAPKILYESEDTPYLNGETLTYDMEGVITRGEKSIAIKLRELKAGEQSGLFSLAMTKPIDITIGESGIPVGTGSLKYAANAARVSKIGATPAEPGAVSLKEGKLDGNLDFAANANGTSQITLTAILHDLVDSLGNKYQNITIDSSNVVNAAKTLLDGGATVKADFGTIVIKDLQLLLADDKGVAPEGVAMLKKATATGTLDIAKLDKISAALGSGVPMGYAGTMTLDQSLTTSGNTLFAKGSIKLTELAAVDPKAPALAIRQVTIENDATVDTVAENAKANFIRIKSPQSEDLDIELTGGMSKYSTAQNLDNVQLNLKLDWAKLWPLLKPIVDPEGSLEPFTIAGRVNETFTARGSLADTRSLDIEGKLPFDKLAMTGADVKGPFVIPIRIKNGIAELAGTSGQAMEPLLVNNGKLNLGGLQVDITPVEGPTISAPKKHYLVQKLELNPLLAAKMGKYISVLFTDPQNASGTVDLTVERMKHIPLADVTSSREGMKFVLSVKPIALDSTIAKQVASFSHLGTAGFIGEIKDAPIELKNGKVTSDINFVLFIKDKDGKTVGQSFQAITNLDVNNLSLAGTSFSFPSWLLRSSDLTKFVGERITVPVTGTTSKLAFDLPGAVRSNVLNSDNVKDTLLDLFKKNVK